MFVALLCFTISAIFIVNNKATISVSYNADGIVEICNTSAENYNGLDIEIWNMDGEKIYTESVEGVYVRIYVNDIEKQKEALDRLMSYRSRFLQIYEYQKQEDDKMAALHAKLIVSDVKKSLVSSANLSYHGMQGNIEMGFLIESHDKAKQIEEVMKEMVRMKVCGKYQ